MQIHLTADQESRLSRIAAHAGTSAEQVVLTAALHVVEDDERRRAALLDGIAQADRGDLLDDDVVRQWLEHREQTV